MHRDMEQKWNNFGETSPESPTGTKSGQSGEDKIVTR